MDPMTEVRVPDLGDFEDVPIIEVLVSVGETVELEQPLIVLESDKASMEVPSTAEGTVEDMAVKVGDTVSKGDLIATVSENGAAPAARDEEQEGEAEERKQACGHAANNAQPPRALTGHSH